MEQQVQSQGAALVTTRSAGIRFGLISALVGIVYFVVLNTLGQDTNEGVWSWLRYPLTMVFIFLAHKYYKDNTEGYLEYGQGVSITVWLGLVSSVIGTVFFYLYIKFIDSSFVEMIKNKQIEKMEEQGMSAEQIDQAMSIASKFMSPEAMFGFGLFFGFLGTLVLGLIVGIFTQKKRPVTF